MDNQSCVYKLCKEDAEIYCKCTDPPLFFCFNHIHEHTNDESHHITEMLFQGISTVQKRLIMSKVNQILGKFKELKTKIVIETEEKTQKISENCKSSLINICKHEKKYINIAEYLQRYDKISKVKQLDDHEKIIFKCCNNNFSSSDWVIIEKDVVLDDFSNETNRQLQEKKRERY